MKPNLLILIVIIILIRLCPCSAGPIYFPAVDMTGATNDVTINVKAVNNPVIWNNSFNFLPKDGTNLTTVNGVVTNQFAPGAYTVSVVGIPQAWTIYVTNNTTAVSAVDLSKKIVIYSGIVSITGSGLQVTNDGAGNYFITATNSGSSGSATNVELAADELFRVTTNAAGFWTGSVKTSAVQQVVRNMNTVSNNHAAALNFPGGVTANSVTSANGISAVTDITTSAGQFNGNAGGVSNVPASMLTGTVPDANLASAITRDTELTAATNAAVARLAAGIDPIAASALTGTAPSATNAVFATDTTFALRFNGRAPQPVIIFADWNSDAGEMAGAKERLARMDRGEIKILAYITSITNEYSAASLAHFLAKYGHPEIPVGVCRTNFYAVVANVTNALFRAVAAGTPLALYNSNYPSASDLVRNVLAPQPDFSLAIDWEGDFAPLWEIAQVTTGDRFSALDGLGLLGRKTRYHFINAGDTNAYDFSTTVTIANTGDLLTHAVLVNSITGQPVQITGAGTVPAQISKDTTYYLIKVSGTTSQLATTYSNSVNGVNIVFNSDSSGALTIEDFLRDQEEGDYNLHVGPNHGPPLINLLTNMVVWNFNKNVFFPPFTTDPAQLLYVGQNVGNTAIHPVKMPVYQDMTNYNYIFSASPIKPPWDAIANGFIANVNNTNAADGTRMYDLSVAGKATVSAAFPGHIFWTNNPVNSGVGTSNHFYITLHSGYQYQITNLVNGYIDSPPFQSGQDYRDNIAATATTTKAMKNMVVSLVGIERHSWAGPTNGLTFYELVDGSSIPNRTGLGPSLITDKGSRDFVLGAVLPHGTTNAVNTITGWGSTNETFSTTFWPSFYVGNGAAGVVPGSTSVQSITTVKSNFWRLVWTNTYNSTIGDPTNTQVSRIYIGVGAATADTQADTNSYKLIHSWTIDYQDSRTP